MSVKAEGMGSGRASNGVIILYRREINVPHCRKVKPSKLYATFQHKRTIVHG